MRYIEAGLDPTLARVVTPLHAMNNADRHDGSWRVQQWFTQSVVISRVIVFRVISRVISRVIVFRVVAATSWCDSGAPRCALVGGSPRRASSSSRRGLSRAGTRGVSCRGGGESRARRATMTTTTTTSVASRGRRHDDQRN